MPKQVRVKDPNNGAEFTTNEFHAEAAGLEVLDKPATDDFGRVFRNNAVMSAMGIPQIAAIMGMCVAGGAYLPVMCDTLLMTEGSGLFLAGPALVQAAIGMKYSAEELGGAQMHAQIAGTIDYREPNDEACITRIRSLVEKMGVEKM